MSYQEKKTIVSTVTGILLLAAYCIWAFGKGGMAAPSDMKLWATTILIFIGVGIAASIVIQIAFHVLLSVSIAVRKKIQDGKVDEKEVEKSIEREMVEDEMDKLIGLKSMRVAFAVAGIGFVAALVSLVLGFSPVAMLNILFISFNIGMIIEGVTQLYYYRRGV